MLQNTEKIEGFIRIPKTLVSGFTLVELLVATAIISVISIFGVNLLWDSLTSRAKQDSIETTSESFRTFLVTLTRSVQEANSINIPNTTSIQITGKPCLTIRYNLTDKSIEEAIDTTPTCVPPAAGASFIRLTREELKVQKFELSPTGFLPNFISVKIEGLYKDSLGEHPFNFYSTITPRVTL